MQHGKSIKPLHLGVKALRWSVAKTLSLLSPVRKIELSDATYYISRTDDYISSELTRKGGYHRERLDHGLRLLREKHRLAPDGVLLNLGAHVGTVLIPALQSRVFQQGLAVEPAPANAALLKRNLAANGLSHCARVARTAVGDEVGKAVLYLSRTNTGNHTLCKGKLVWNPLRPQATVDVTTIDRLLKVHAIEPEDVSFVVMDIQGFELPAIVGGASLFCCSPPLMIEMDHHYMGGPKGQNALCKSLVKHYESFLDLDDVTSSARSTSGLNEYVASFSGYRDLLFF